MRLKWQVGLSNGETFIEGKAPFEKVEGELSPWLKLQEYLKETGYKITSLCLVHGNRRFNLPSLGKNPKFSAFYTDYRPTGYNYFKMVGGDIKPNSKVDVFHVIEAIYEHESIQLWVDSGNPDNCYLLLNPEGGSVL